MSTISSSTESSGQSVFYMKQINFFSFTELKEENFIAITKDFSLEKCAVII